LRTRPAWKGLRALEMGHVGVVGEEFIRPSPGLIDAIEQLAHELHPEAFSEKTSQQREQRIENGPRFDATTLMMKDCNACAH